MIILFVFVFVFSQSFERPRMFLRVNFDGRNVWEREVTIWTNLDNQFKNIYLRVQSMKAISLKRDELCFGISPRNHPWINVTAGICFLGFFLCYGNHRIINCFYIKKIIIKKWLGINERNLKGRGVKCRVERWKLMKLLSFCAL